MSRLTYRTIPCAATNFRQLLMQKVCMEIGSLEYAEHLGIYVPTCQKTFFYLQGEQSTFATAVRDDSVFPDCDNDFEVLLVHFPAGYGMEAAHADPLGVPRLVAQVARDFIAYRLRTLVEEVAE